MNNKIILSTAYFPPIQYMTKFLSDKGILIESCENYIKQTYRNRCNILTANGVQSLVIPVKKNSDKHNSIKETEIDYKTNWPDIHLKTLDVAYKSSPYYEYYIDSIKKILEKKEKYLFALNNEILRTILTETEINKTYSFSEEYLHLYQNDFRNCISTKEKFKTEDLNFKQKKYTQVFSDKFPFIENLSILDLLFNEGPNTEIYLKQCIITI